MSARRESHAMFVVRYKIYISSRYDKCCGNVEKMKREKEHRAFSEAMRYRARFIHTHIAKRYKQT